MQRARQLEGEGVPRKAIRVLSLDFDTCLFHQAYHCRLQDVDKNPNRLIEHNEEFLKRLARDVAASAETVLFVGSNRQSQFVDDNNLHKTGLGFNESCFPALVKINDDLNRRTQSDKCRVDGYLLSDVYGQREPGFNFRHLVLDAEQRGEFAADEWCFDDQKLSILYAQMHKIASENPDSEISFDFYDDSLHVLEPLGKFFKRVPEFIPPNVTLTLFQYAEGKADKVKRYASFYGAPENKTDANYHLNIPFMLRCAGFEGEYNFLQHHPLAMLLTPERVCKFLSGRSVEKGIESKMPGLKVSAHSMFASDDCSTTEPLDDFGLELRNAPLLHLDDSDDAEEDEEDLPGLVKTPGRGYGC